MTNRKTGLFFSDSFTMNPNEPEHQRLVAALALFVLLIYIIRIHI